MADSSAVRRKLFMHPAHRAVGVSGDGIAIGPYCRIARFSTDNRAIAPTRLALAARRLDADALAALALFEQAIDRRCDVQCRRVELDAVDAGLESLAEADCVVVFGRWLQVARHWSDLDAVLLADDGPRSRTDERMEIEIAATARRHPLLEGVEPFVARQDAARRVCIPRAATLLLCSRTAGEVQPAAWIEPRRHGKVFCTTLGSAEDFHRPDFVRLVLNALVWIGR